MMKITLQVRGREMTFSQEEIVSILEKHFDTKEAQLQKENIQTTETKQQAKVEVAQMPIEGKWFEVNPLLINQSLFLDKRDDEQQEETRQIILEAFNEMKKNCEYEKPFETLMPEKTWNEKNIIGFMKMACYIGDHMADWIEQALEWAQRIANGETWEAICNKPDTANWYRLIKWKNGYKRLVGGSRKSFGNGPASSIGQKDYCFDFSLGSTVPLVVRYK